MGGPRSTFAHRPSPAKSNRSLRTLSVHRRGRSTVPSVSRRGILHTNALPQHSHVVDHDPTRAYSKGSYAESEPGRMMKPHAVVTLASALAVGTCAGAQGDAEAALETATRLFAALEASAWEEAANHFHPAWLEQYQRDDLVQWGVLDETGARLELRPGADRSDFPLNSDSPERLSPSQYMARSLEAVDRRRSSLEAMRTQMSSEACYAALVDGNPQPLAREPIGVVLEEPDWAHVVYRETGPSWEARRFDWPEPVRLLRLRRTGEEWKVWTRAEQFRVTAFIRLDLPDGCNDDVVGDSS